jgi:hypothetical protein
MQPVIASEPIRETRGDDWIWPLRFRNAQDAPVDLTGCVFDGAAIKWLGGELPLTVQNGRLVVDPQAGAVTINVARNDTAPVPAGRRSRLVLPITDTLDRKSTLIIIRISIREP